MSSDLEKLRFPIGKYKMEPVQVQDYPMLIDQLEALPDRIRAEISGLTDEQLDTPYREGGWTLRQVVHHLPDSHFKCLYAFQACYN